MTLIRFWSPLLLSAVAGCGPGLSSDANGVVSGYLAPDLATWEETQVANKKDFKVMLAEGPLSATTDEDGRFELRGVPAGMPHALIIAKATFLARKVLVPAGIHELGALASPICVWPGDMDGNGVIDKADGEAWKALFEERADGGFGGPGDLDQNGPLDMSDLQLISKHFEASYPEFPACSPKESCPCPSGS